MRFRIWVEAIDLFPFPVARPRAPAKEMPLHLRGISTELFRQTVTLLSQSPGRLRFGVNPSLDNPDAYGQSVQRRRKKGA